MQPSFLQQPHAFQSIAGEGGEAAEDADEEKDAGVGADLPPFKKLPAEADEQGTDEVDGEGAPGEAAAPAVEGKLGNGKAEGGPNGSPGGDGEVGLHGLEGVVENGR